MTDPVFFAPSRRISISEIAELTGAKLADQTHGERLVDGIASAADGGEGKLVFVEGKRNATLLKSLSAAAVLCTSDFEELVPPGIAALVTPKPQRAFALIGRLLYPAAARPLPMTSSIRYLEVAGRTRPTTRLTSINARPSASRPLRARISARASRHAAPAESFFLGVREGSAARAASDRRPRAASDRGIRRPPLSPPGI
jgi:hypothetical protein